jgi:hypothetical protein
VDGCRRGLLIGVQGSEWVKWDLEGGGVNGHVGAVYSLGDLAWLVLKWHVLVRRRFAWSKFVRPIVGLLFSVEASLHVCPNVACCAASLLLFRTSLVVPRRSCGGSIDQSGDGVGCRSRLLVAVAVRCSDGLSLLVPLRVDVFVALFRCFCPKFRFVLTVVKSKDR